MEIYHRDHLEHNCPYMAIGNDLNKENEENKMIDWINDIGSSVKHCC